MLWYKCNLQDPFSNTSSPADIPLRPAQRLPFLSHVRLPACPACPDPVRRHLVRGRIVNKDVS